jgi:hypothetical protein
MIRPTTIDGRCFTRQQVGEPVLLDPERGAFKWHTAAVAVDV